MTLRPQRLISKAELARRVTCARAYTYRMCKPGGKLAAAVVGSQVDLNHPDAAHFCASQGYTEPDGAAIAAAVRAKVTPTRAHTPPAYDRPDMFDNIDADDITAGDLLAMPLGECVARYGTASVLKDYVSIVKSLVQTRGYEDDQARKRGEYIHRVHVEQLVAHIDALQKALLTDSVRNMTLRATAQVSAGASATQIEASMRDVISRTIKAAKSELVRRLRDV